MSGGTKATARQGAPARPLEEDDADGAGAVGDDPNLASRDAEEAVVASLLQGGSEAFTEVRELLTAGDFVSIPLGILFATIARLVDGGSPVELPLVGDALQRSGDFDRIGGAFELTRLLERVPSAANVAFHAAIVRDRAERRRLIAACERTKRQAASLAIPLAAIVPVEPPRPLVASATVPKFISVAELRAQAASVASAPFLVDGLLPSGSTSIWCGRPKSGKSTLALQLVAAVERGERFLDRTTTPTTAVLASEEGAGTLAEKLDAFGIERARIVTRAHLGAFGGGAPLRKLIEAAAAEAIATDAKLLVVDTFGAWARLGGDRENDAGEVLAAVEPLGVLAERGITAIVLHHSRKSETLDPADAVRGSGALAGAFDLVLDLQRADSANAATARKLVVLSRSSAVDVPELALDYLDGSYHVAMSTADAVGAGIRRKIIEVVRGASVPLERDEVLDAIGGRRATVLREMGKLLDAGEVRRTGRGKPGDPFRFSVPDAENGCSRSGPVVRPFPPIGGGTENGLRSAVAGTDGNGGNGSAGAEPSLLTNGTHDDHVGDLDLDGDLP